jgi:hypothetical protein
LSGFSGALSTTIADVCGFAKRICAVKSGIS